MDFGLFAPTANPFATPEWLDALGRGAEERGVHSLWVPEHVVLFEEYASRYPYAADGRIPAPPGSGMLEPFTTLSFLAACTTTVRLGTAICLLPQRNPVYAAKEVATLDWLSNGRVDFGIGVGWLAEEFAAVNVPWPQRGRRTDDYLRVMKALWCEDPSSYEGEFYSLPSCSMYPKPVQTPHPPLHIGGESDAALRRVARVGQGWFTFNRLPAEVPEGMERLRRELDHAGRDRSEVTVTVCPYFNGCTPEMVEQYAQAGVDQVVALFFAMTADDVPAALDELQPCLDRARSLSS
ncbi:MAG: LLM class F420-dependent oxidoreductase [Acidimicrobiales bacterium]|jgi:probable F420-dependent oxidoreductase